MSNKRSPGLIVRGVKSARGYPMACISDYVINHYELVSELILNRKAAMARMADRGLVAVGPRESYIIEQLGHLTFDAEKLIYDSCGWNGGIFVDGAKRLYVPDGAVTGDAVFSAPIERFRTSGSIEGWLDEVAGPLSGHMVAEFVLGLMFAGVLVGFTGHTLNPGFALIGLPEDGKSLLLQIVASACGAPTSNNKGDGYPLSFSGTEAGIADEMQELLRSDRNLG